MMRLLLFMLCVVLASAPAFAADPAPVAGSKGMVVSAQHLASDVGADILRLADGRTRP